VHTVLVTTTNQPEICQHCGRRIARSHQAPLAGTQAIRDGVVTTLDGTVCRICLRAAGYRPFVDGHELP
jgi:hypothetical protein